MDAVKAWVFFFLFFVFLFSTFHAVLFWLVSALLLLQLQGAVCCLGTHQVISMLQQLQKVSSVLQESLCDLWVKTPFQQGCAGED